MNQPDQPTGRWSLRRRLAMAAGLAAAVVLAGTATVVFFVARTQMIADFDRIWQARGESVASALEYDRNGWDLDERPETMAVFAAASTEAAYQIRVGEMVVARSPSLAGRNLPQEALVTQHCSQWTTMPDGRIGRTQSWLFTPDHEAQSPPAPQASIVVAAAADDLRRAISALAWLLIWATALGTGVSALLMALVATRAMRPLVELSGLLAVRTPGSASPVALADPPRELVPVVARLNDAFGRLETALEREKGFTADAAHELRTPLAALRLLLEVSQSEADPADARRGDVGEAHALALRLQRIVDALLALARLDRGLVAPRPALVSLDALIEEAWAGVASAASTRGITYRCTGSVGLAIWTDPDLLRQILANLCDNAVSHGDADSEVLCTASATYPGQAVLTISNDASTAPADLSAAGQRFWRADQARTDYGRHVGIGLSLCQRMVGVLRGGLQMERRGSQVAVTLQIADLKEIAVESPLAADQESGPTGGHLRLG